MIKKVVAIVGASGNVGKAFADNFLAANAFQLRVPVGASSVGTPTYQGYQQCGATLHIIDFEDESTIVEVFNGVDVFISAVAGTAWSSQFPLVEVASKAGVKVFFPNEYACDFEDDQLWPSAQVLKNARKAAQSLGVPTAIPETAAFPELVLTPISYWLTYVLKMVPVEQLQNRRFKIQRNRNTFNEIVKLREQKYNDQLEVEYRPIKELKDRFAADHNDTFVLMMIEITSGRLNIGGKDNWMYPEWQPDTIESVL